jgi:enoyl-CoA hydratase/carnithine racemase
MYQFIIVKREDNIGLITLNRPESLNAWHKPMRDELSQALRDFDQDEEIRAIILTATGDRAFSAGQDLGEAKHFDETGAEDWMTEWRHLYGLLRSLSKGLVVALNGLAAGSGFQVALLGDVRVAHHGVKMGQPEINNGIASVTGPWIMKEMIGLSRTIELTLTGRMMDAQECHQIGLIHYLVEQDELMNEALRVARLLAEKPPLAMKLTRQRFQEATEPGFQEMLIAGTRIQRESYASGEPQSLMETFLQKKKNKH